LSCFLHEWSAVLRLNPTIDILRVGESNTPPLGTLDPDVLGYLQLSQRLLVTDNRASMPAHLSEHYFSIQNPKLRLM
jgi:hypothetical protein